MKFWAGLTVKRKILVSVLALVGALIKVPRPSSPDHGRRARRGPDRGPAQGHRPGEGRHRLRQGHGKDALLKQVNFGTGKFHVGPGRPLYLFVYDGAGKCMAQGSTSTFVGTNRLAVKDPDGKPYIAEIIKLGKDAGKGWVDYKFLNPADGRIEPKTTYLEACEGWVVCCGIYK